MIPDAPSNTNALLSNNEYVPPTLQGGTVESPVVTPQLATTSVDVVLEATEDIIEHDQVAASRLRRQAIAGLILCSLGVCVSWTCLVWFLPLLTFIAGLVANSMVVSVTGGCFPPTVKISNRTTVAQWGNLKNLMLGLVIGCKVVFILAVVTLVEEYGMVCKDLLVHEDRYNHETRRINRIVCTTILVGASLTLVLSVVTGILSLLVFSKVRKTFIMLRDKKGLTDTASFMGCCY